MTELHLPWRVDPDKPWLVYDAGGNRVTGRGSHGMTVTLAQMAHLVRAANAHRRLVAAGRRLLQFPIPPDCPEWQEFREAVEDAEG